ncbi:ComF family protein [Pedobacter punctiformis]|uniref:Phosphoribosyltransferase family protein n=1 Tax=Pedobacter punctiformis TaxID=3004097 RepID=A0ABT4L5D5_9SPHI|nr:phosphoribosyltransferase family protein [Pedobacter sp. HCMS5-2]MCZ4242897.1 phosphoribosyltransferase family protein [Pedobacter sp. HCMS5-2]
MITAKLWFDDLVGLLFPRLCNACGSSLVHSENQICIKCLYDLPFTDYHTHEENRVARQLWGRVPLNAAMAMLYFKKGTKVQKLIHNLKYNNKTEVGLILGNLLGERLKTSSLYQDIDLIVPVPLHLKKFRLRGYNQSTFIAAGIAQKMNVPFDDSILLRSIATESQTRKSRYNRYENMLEVFTVKNQQSVLNKHILIVDDVITTGATLEACASILLNNGAAKISIAALAFAD